MADLPALRSFVWVCLQVTSASKTYHKRIAKCPLEVQMLSAQLWYTSQRTMCRLVLAVMSAHTIKLNTSKQSLWDPGSLQILEPKRLL